MVGQADLTANSCHGCQTEPEKRPTTPTMVKHWIGPVMHIFSSFFGKGGSVE